MNGFTKPQEVTGVSEVTNATAVVLKLTVAQARQRFAAAPVARLATVGLDGKPKTTTNLRRLRNIGRDPRVAVLADHYEADWDRLWWARADGLASILGESADRARPLELLAARYPQYRATPPAGPVIAIAVERWTGWAATGWR